MLSKYWLCPYFVIAPNSTPNIVNSGIPVIASSNLPGITTAITNSALDTTNIIIGSAVGGGVALLVAILTIFLLIIVVSWRKRKLSRKKVDFAIRYSNMQTNCYCVSMYSIECTFALMFTFNQSNRTYGT